MKFWKYDRNKFGENALTLVDDLAVTEPSPIEQPAARSEQRAALIDQPVAPVEAIIEARVAPPPVAELPVATNFADGSIAKSIEAGMRAERAEIVRRVNAFKELQLRVKRDREAYCDAVVEKTFASLRHPAKHTR